MRNLEIRAHLLARNTFLNFIGRACPLVVAVITVPFIVHGLGTDRFGLLSFAWVILGYFSIFDLGLSRATTKYVAEYLGKGSDEEISHLVWTSVTLQFILGFIGGIILFNITPLLTERILNIPQYLIIDAKYTFYILALSLPIIFISGSFRGVLEAFQRFDLINAIKIPTTILAYIFPLVGVLLKFHIHEIIILILSSRIGSLIFFIIMNIRLKPELKNYSCSLRLIPNLFVFGGWVAISNIFGPILIYLDRFLIASIISISAVSYYSVPYEAVTRLWIIPASLTMSLFPAFSTLGGMKDIEKIKIIFARSVKYIILSLGIIIIFIILYANEILTIWLGNEFSIKSTFVFQMLSIGIFINSTISWSLYTLLQGVGRPDLPSKFILIEIPIYVIIAWILIKSFGIKGAAVAWSIRALLDAILLFMASKKIFSFNIDLLRKNGVIFASFVYILVACISYEIKELIKSYSLITNLMVAFGLFVFLIIFIWKVILDSLDRSVILKAVGMNY